MVDGFSVTVHIHGDFRTAHVGLPYRVVRAFLCGYHTAPHVAPHTVHMWLLYSSCVAAIKLPSGSNTAPALVPNSVSLCGSHTAHKSEIFHLIFLYSGGRAE